VAFGEFERKQIDATVGALCRRLNSPDLRASYASRTRSTAVLSRCPKTALPGTESVAERA
jgi:hypothetical protein